jgi:DNA-binding response OmpR family regulator/signal transduction histidine kinase
MSAVLSVVAFDFFFVPPRYTFAVTDVQYLLTFTGLLLVGLVVSTLAAQAREQANTARHRQSQTAALNDLSRDLAATAGLDPILDVICRFISTTFSHYAGIFLPEGERLALSSSTAPAQFDEDEVAVADWAFRNRQPAGRGTETLPAANAAYFPMATANGIIGVIGTIPSSPGQSLPPDQRRLLEASISLAALAIERAQLSEQASRVRLLQESERLQTALLNSISHDLRTPLASITGALSSLEQDAAVLDEAARRELVATALGQAERLNRLVGNLLDMTRLEAGTLRIVREPNDVGDLIGVALQELPGPLQTHPLAIDVPADLPPADGSGLDGAGAGQRARQCHEVLAGRQSDRDRRPAAGSRIERGRRPGCPRRSDRHRSPRPWHRNPTRRPESGVRQVLSGAAPGQPRRHRPGTLHQPRFRRSARRPDLGGSAARRRHDRDDLAADSGRPMTRDSVRVLVVDDEVPIRRFLRTSLSAHGHTVFEAGTAEEALRSVSSNRPDLVILDLGLPDADGTEVVRSLRGWTRLPIIILSVRDHEKEKITALDAGADDYLTKPFGVDELMARMRVALRHSAAPGDEPVFTSGALKVDLARRSVTLEDREVQLTPTEYDLLRVLVTHAGKVVTHRQLLRAVWGDVYDEESHLLRVHISNLRSKLEPEPARPMYILTEPGVGYRLRAAD